MLPDYTDLLKGLNEIAVHRGCQKSLYSVWVIAASIKRLSVLEQEARTATRSKGTVFNFKNHCFMCGKKITAEFLAAQKKLPFSKRNNVMPSLREAVWKTAENRGAEWAHNIINRLQSTEGLVKDDAQYHLFCHRKLYKQPSTSHKKGRKPADNVNEAMEQIISYLEENSEECQFSMDELINKIEGDYVPDV
ncbi:hypothetical protein AVEN_179541-1 [Araneus ventricosus]|uniref:Uncharacterized protein n=1 Tax=Araneus ventricosus TaxID=182803 RepID=A0A4Y2TRS4_ARAVE|nr:hypothetical protein AVEN_236774-1 [Araneus ventricosus]GBO02038.1 hypothetical protein AVEN_114675-1 [Araneus ventricosus]GBO02374.1 hypothetical protein AVEN_189570-1 [Araneus ventricosus]GBO02386.1 hypothetical protein AVEN_179541-1 [Araneus ventricosus]